MKIGKDKKGFTLIELLATIIIIAIVFSIALYVSLNAIEKSQEKSYKLTINNIQKAASNYLFENSDRLFFISYGEDTDQLGKNIEYQCITVQNLIDMGYFDKNITESKIDKRTYVTTDMYVYIERNKTTKVFNKTVLASIADDGEIPSGISCSEVVNAKGDVSFVVEPLDWSKEKKITLYYSLSNLNNNTSIDDYKFDYEYSKISEEIYNNTTEKKIKVTNKGTLNAYITLETMGDITSKSLKIDNIDNVGPVIKLGNISQEYVSKTVTIPLKVSDIGSGVNYNSFTQSDITVTIGKNVISDISLENLGKGDFNLVVNNDIYNGEVVITIPKNSVYDNVVDEIKNGNNETILKPELKFDNTAPMITLGANSDSTYTKTKSVTVSIKDANSGLASGGSLKYGWSASATAEPTSYTTVTPSYTNGVTSAVTFTARGSNLTGNYYLWVVPVSLSDVAGNNATTIKSTGTFKFDNTAPMITLGANSDSTYTKAKSVTVSIKDANSGLASGGSLKYGWSASATTEPTSYTMVTPSYTNGVTSAVTFTATGSGLTGNYYLWVVPVSLSDVAGNNATTIKSTGTFKFDNTAPSCIISVTTYPQSAKLTLKGSDANGLHAKPYSWSSGTSGFGTIQTKTVTQNGTYYGYVKDIAGNVKSCSTKINNIGSGGSVGLCGQCSVDTDCIQGTCSGTCTSSSGSYSCCVTNDNDLCN